MKNDSKEKTILEVVTTLLLIIGPFYGWSFFTFQSSFQSMDIIFWSVGLWVVTYKEGEDCHLDAFSHSRNHYDTIYDKIQARTTQFLLT